MNMSACAWRCETLQSVWCDMYRVWGRSCEKPSWNAAMNQHCKSVFRIICIQEYFTLKEQKYLKFTDLFTEACGTVLTGWSRSGQDKIPRLLLVFSIFLCVFQPQNTTIIPVQLSTEKTTNIILQTSITISMEPFANILFLCRGHPYL